MQTWLLDLPYGRPVTLNDRMSHIVRWKRTKPYREAAYVLARAAKIPPCDKVRVTLIYTPRDRRVRDPLNLVPTVKALEDGLVDAGVVPDDNPTYLQSVMPLIDAPDSKNPKLQLYIERIK